MSWRTTGFLFLILVLVAGLVFWQNRQQQETETSSTVAAPSPQAGADLFGNASVENVVRLDVATGADVSASFHRDESGSWSMTVPTSTQVISTTMANAVRGLISVGSRRTLPPEENPLQAYGLEQPQQQVTLAVQDEGRIVRHLLSIGNETPTGDAYYVLKEGDRRVHLVAKSALDSVLDLAQTPPVPEPGPTLPITGTVPVTSTTPLLPTLTPPP